MVNSSRHVIWLQGDEHKLFNKISWVQIEVELRHFVSRKLPNYQTDNAVFAWFFILIKLNDGLYNIINMQFRCDLCTGYLLGLQLDVWMWFRLGMKIINIFIPALLWSEFGHNLRLLGGKTSCLTLFCIDLSRYF